MLLRPRPEERASRTVNSPNAICARVSKDEAARSFGRPHASRRIAARFHLRRGRRFAAPRCSSAEAERQDRSARCCPSYSTEKTYSAATRAASATGSTLAAENFDSGLFPEGAG